MLGTLGYDVYANAARVVQWDALVPGSSHVRHKFPSSLRALMKQMQFVDAYILGRSVHASSAFHVQFLQPDCIIPFSALETESPCHPMSAVATFDRFSRQTHSPTMLWLIQVPLKPHTHQVLLVKLGGKVYLVDVGFMSDNHCQPLPLQHMAASVSADGLPCGRECSNLSAF